MNETTQIPEISTPARLPEAINYHRFPATIAAFQISTMPDVLINLYIPRELYDALPLFECGKPDNPIKSPDLTEIFMKLNVNICICPEE